MAAILDAAECRVIDARLQFGLARMKASAQRVTLADNAEVEVDLELLDSELRAAMRTGQGFSELYDGTPCDMDGRIIE